MKQHFLLFLSFYAYVAQAQIMVDKAGGCGGSSPCYKTIQAGVNASNTAGDVIIVYPGNYTENVLVNKSITLRSLSGAGSTTITGIGPADGQAPVMIQGPVSNVTIGGSAGHGFTLLGVDNVSVGPESAALFVNGISSAVKNTTISYNTITAQGDDGILALGTVQGITIEQNLLNGATFTGSTPVDLPSPFTAFTDVNQAKPAISVNVGASNTNIKNNTITTSTGGNDGSKRGNYQMIVGSTGSTITLNDLKGNTSGFRGGMGVKGTDALVTCNKISLASNTTSNYAEFISTNAPTPYWLVTVALNNTFLPIGYLFTYNNSIITTFTGTPANTAYPAPGCVTLPLSFVNIAAQQLGTGGINVSWQTVNEINNAYFVVEQSSDGISFLDAAHVKSNGSGNFNYSTTIMPNTAGNIFIRLKQIDIDGNFTLSKIIKLDAINENKVQVLNNPAVGSLSIYGIQGKTTLKLYNSTGALVKQTVTSNQSITMDITDLPIGMYFLNTVGSNQNTATIKVLIH